MPQLQQSWLSLGSRILVPGLIRGPAYYQLEDLVERSWQFHECAVQCHDI
jgi:hypothetical protein